MPPWPGANCIRSSSCTGASHVISTDISTSGSTSGIMGAANQRDISSSCHASLRPPPAPSRLRHSSTGTSSHAASSRTHAAPQQGRSRCCQAYDNSSISAYAGTSITSRDLNSSCTHTK